jgi:outer membrane protein
MKKITLITLILLLAGTAIYSEDQKIAYINSDRVLEQSSDGQRIQTIISALQEEWNNQLQQKETVLKAKYEEYDNLPVMVEDSVKKSLENEIIELENQYRMLQEEIRQKANSKQEELLMPIFQKLGDVTKKIASENGYTAIFDLNMSGFVYIDSTLDVTDMVLEQMNK